MVITTGMIITMGLQVGASFLTQKLNAKKVKELKRLQQESKEAAAARGIMYDYEKFKESCEFQAQIEEKSHRYKLETIGNRFIEKLTQWAHNENVKSHYPLKISPYIVQKSVLPICGTQLEHSRQEILCILTSSNNDEFNAKILPYIDELLCKTISTLWNQQSLHTMCYYRKAWDENVRFCEENIENLKAIISTPTITVTPFFANEGKEQSLEVEINLWEGQNSFSYHLPTAIKSSHLENLLTKENLNSFIDSLFPIILCPMAHIVDVYYWTNYYYTPFLPLLISDGLIKLNEEMRVQFARDYCNLYNTLALGNDLPADLVCSTDRELIKNIAEINQYNFPNRNMSFLQAVLKMNHDKSDVDKMILNTLASLYESRTTDSFKSAKMINVAHLNKNDMALLTLLNEIAKTKGCRNLSNDITDIISRKILEWD